MLLTSLALHLALHSPALQAQQPARDTTKPRPPVPPALLANAFKDDDARTLLNTARRARMTQDSALRSYDAKVRQRLSVHASVGRLAPERLVYRQESAARVQWQRGTGAHIEMTGARVAIPVVGSTKEDRDAMKGNLADVEMSPIPYFPGSETLWVGGGSARADVDEGSMINPLANGAEEFYTYQTGDSATFRLPDGAVVRLRELSVRPRVPRSNLVVGALWFDTNSGQLVRAAYRLAAPAGARVGVSNRDDSTAAGAKIATAILRAITPATRAEVSSVVVEYGLFEGRFWLPRSQALDGYASASFVRIPVKFENAFDYESVNAPLALTAISVDTTIREGVAYPRTPRGLDSAARRIWRDSAMVVYNARIKARADSVAAGMQVGSFRQCESSSTRVITRYRYSARIPVQLRIPCNLDSLEYSADFTGSIYDANEEVFGSAELDRLVSDALGLASQAPFSLLNLRAPRLQYGLSMTRYNRVEGLSTGVAAEQQVGGGYSALALARFGFGDDVLNAEFSVARSNASKTIRLGAYKRLAASNDWGNPLSFGSSFSALFGRDDGFYYRAKGGELLWTTERGVRLDWRAFAEKQSTATATRTGAIVGGFGPNIVTPAMTSYGAVVRLVKDIGLDPRGVRAFTDLRLEGAGGDSTYGRAALDLTLSAPLRGDIAASLTLASGTSVGGLPIQRHWFLGGAQTIRGQDPSASLGGNAFWMTRAELARSYVGYRLAAFGDLGWTGDRTRFTEVGRPMSGVGVGMSAFDGLLRLDVARGLYPQKQTNLYLYLGARF